MTDARVVAVVATYNPDVHVLHHVRDLMAQVDAVVVTDDGSITGQDVLLELKAEGAEIVRHPTNTGIAASLNRGVARAVELGADHVLTLDQDSQPCNSYVGNVLRAETDALADGVNVGLVSAASYAGRPTPRGPRIGDWVSAFDPLQSGSLYRTAVLQEVGPFDEGFVIDGVDSDYTARLREDGYALIIAPEADLGHSLGRREPMTVLGAPVRLLGRTVSYNYHAPSRVYYMTRNGCAIIERYARTQPRWVARRVVEECKAHCMRLILGNNRCEVAKAMIAGFRDAHRGKSGPYVG